jgi:hypothetical protein
MAFCWVHSDGHGEKAHGLAKLSIGPNYYYVPTLLTVCRRMIKGEADVLLVDPEGVVRSQGGRRTPYAPTYLSAAVAVGVA